MLKHAKITAKDQKIQNFYNITVVSIGTTCITRKNRFNKANKKSDFRKFLQNIINEAKTLINIQESQIGNVKTK